MFFVVCNAVPFFCRVARVHFWSLLGWSVQIQILCLKWFSVLISIRDTSKQVVDFHLTWECTFFPVDWTNVKPTIHHYDISTASYAKCYPIQVGHVDSWFGASGSNWWILWCGLWDLWTQIFELVLSSHQLVHYSIIYKSDTILKQLHIVIIF
jgi:hypothetical protein